MLKAFLCISLISFTLLNCARYDQRSHGQRETAEAEQTKLANFEVQFKDEGLDLAQPSRWHETLAQFSMNDLKSLAKSLKNYLQLSMDVEHLATIRGVHGLDAEQASTRTKRAQALLNEVNAELGESGSGWRGI